MTRPTLVVIDGSTALHRVVADVFDHPVIQRCQLQKLRTVRDRLRTPVERRMRRRLSRASALDAEAH